MAHTCKTALVRCMDFRLGNAIKKYLEAEGLYDDCDIISIAGAAKDIIENSEGFLASQIEISKNLHGINTVILMNHTDCGGYGGSAKHENATAEREFHVSELGKARDIIATKYPDLNIKLMLAQIHEDGKIEISEINE